MAEKATIKFRDIARESNASADQVKYWIKLLRIRPQIRGRTGYLTQPEAALLREMIQRVGEGESPKEAAEVLTDSVPVYPLDSSESSPSLVNIYETMGNMKEVLLVMATELRTTHEKMDIMTQRSLAFAQKISTCILKCFSFYLQNHQPNCHPITPKPLLKA